ncbi:hypothetical protein L249_7967, partial [Ophiocordyceps polyrhachis-furcata BCC 54312]
DNTCTSLLPVHPFSPWIKKRNRTHKKHHHDPIRTENTCPGRSSHPRTHEATMSTIYLFVSENKRFGISLIPPPASFEYITPEFRVHLSRKRAFSFILADSDKGRY